MAPCCAPFGLALHTTTHGFLASVEMSLTSRGFGGGRAREPQSLHHEAFWPKTPARSLGSPILFPAGIGVGVAAGEHVDPVHDHEGGVKADAELADQ
jgi:hypothetical protein